MGALYDAARLERIQQQDARKQVLDDKRLDMTIAGAEMDRKDRSLSMQERKEMIGVVGALVKKLN